MKKQRQAAAGRKIWAINKSPLFHMYLNERLRIFVDVDLDAQDRRPTVNRKDTVSLKRKTSLGQYELAGWILKLLQHPDEKMSAVGTPE